MKHTSTNTFLSFSITLDNTKALLKTLNTIHASIKINLPLLGSSQFLFVAKFSREFSDRLEKSLKQTFEKLEKNWIQSKYKDFPLNFMNMKIATGERRENQCNPIFVLAVKKVKLRILKYYCKTEEKQQKLLIENSCLLFICFVQIFRGIDKVYVTFGSLHNQLFNFMNILVIFPSTYFFF